MHALRKIFFKIGVTRVYLQVTGPLWDTVLRITLRAGTQALLSEATTDSEQQKQ